MRDVNHHQLDTFLAWIKCRPIQLRFIELMETGEGSELFRRHHISGMGAAPISARRFCTDEAENFSALRWQAPSLPVRGWRRRSARFAGSGSEALTHKKQTHFLHQGNTGITQNLSYIGGNQALEGTRR
ncbi:molybdenum cofactor biosynthesis protein A [Enterobacter hormaechei subsp. xiangfangensis]|nr:molybdenum cofactor biosynthesis protein A [Enterobacter hormaechei subsp. xiangfangensis]